MSDAVAEAARILHAATALLITAGAGMSADSGLPTFRDKGGLWRQREPMQIPGVTPNSFDDKPAAAWGFYAIRRAQYLATPPHEGYGLLLRLAQRMRDGWFVYTSNVDEHFQKSGFDAARLVECHGNLSWAQCQERCCDEVFQLAHEVAVDVAAERALEPLPACPRCSALARPNVLLFYDFGWVGTRMNRQHDAMEAWLAALPSDRRLVILELGAGTAVPSVRVCGEDVARRHQGHLIRVNPNEPDVEQGLSVPLGALEALNQLLVRAHS